MTKADLPRARAIANLYRAGSTLREIATKFEISHVRVLEILRTHTGVEIRSRGGDMTKRRTVEAC